MTKPSALPAGPWLALDTASPWVSVAVGRGEETLAERSVELQRSAAGLLGWVQQVLDEAGLRFGDLGAVLVLSGPGSFTGLRVGLATAQGFHQATGIPVAALPTLPVVALAAARARPAAPRVHAVVNAQRGEWFVEEHVRGADGGWRRGGETRCLRAADLAAQAPALLAGFGAAQLAAATDWPEPPEVFEPGPLARTALVWAASHPPDFDPRHLTRPLYLRAPAVTLPATPP